MKENEQGEVIAYSPHSSMDSFLAEDYAEQNGIIIKDNTPFDDIFAEEYSEELEKHREISQKILEKTKMANDEDNEEKR
jgi:hypothetical protein